MPREAAQHRGRSLAHKKTAEEKMDAREHPGGSWEETDEEQRRVTHPRRRVALRREQARSCESVSKIEVFLRGTERMMTGEIRSKGQPRPRQAL